ncbi:hypothetical protein M1K46_10385 [Fictibacillus sp. WQ 8-8]|uniref:hypothetical protein n=1 Tax=unclassified Fictibacillus TaxID=2644029 RepID=UPI000AAA7445|nr:MULTISPECIES: hypothetical protein [unclassified Fictibacillus]MCQ6266070.1 hypothetical protein [Fictibacillus sp. WQ 8-8]UZJ80790.1 hypothetical protein OKX00_10255 [Fictibacillus sp. KU28468]
MKDYGRRFLVVLAITLCIGILFVGGKGGKAKSGESFEKHLKEAEIHVTKVDKDLPKN